MSIRHRRKNREELEGVSLMDGIRAELVGFTPDYMEILQLSAGKCYGNKVSYKGIQRIINSGHLSVLEHCNAIIDVDCSNSCLRTTNKT